MTQIRNPDAEKQWLSRAEVAEIFQVAPGTVTRWADAGKLPVTKTLGGHRRYEAQAVMTLARQLGQIHPETQQEATRMEKMAITVPAMYGDHHVVDVRRMLLALPGIETIYASSAFKVVELTYDPDQLNPETVQTLLDEAGYLEEIASPTESGLPVTQDAARDKAIFFRHSTAYQQAGQEVSFGQTIAHTGRPLWPCPGIGPLTRQAAGEETHG